MSPQLRRRVIPGSNSGSSVTTAGTPAPKYSISTSVPGPAAAAAGPGVGDVLPRGAAVGRAGHIPRRAPLHVHRLAAHHDLGRIGDDQAGQPLPGPGPFPGHQRVPAQEVTLARPDREAEPGLVRVVFGGHVHAPGPVALFQPQAVERGPARRDHAVVRPGRPQRVPQPGPGVRAGVQLRAQLAHAGQPQGGDRDVAHVAAPGLEVAERLAGSDRGRSAAAAGRGRPRPHSPRQHVPPVMSRSCTNCSLAPSEGTWRRNQSRSSGPLTPTWNSLGGQPGHGQVAADAAVRSSSSSV